MTTQNIIPAQSNTYTVGAILVDTWGFEQTNVDFYCIIKVSGSFVTVQKMTIKQDYNPGNMTAGNAPGVIDITAAPIRKKLKKDWTGEHGFSFRDYTGGGWC